MHVVPPRRGDRRRPPPGAEQASGDGGHGVGVVADPHGGVQRAGQRAGALLGGAEHRRGGGLQRRHRPAVRVESAPGQLADGCRPRLAEPCLPPGASRDRQQVEPGPHLDACLEHRDPHRLRPEHARVAGGRVGVGEGGDPPGCPRRSVPVVERRQRDHCGAHQGAVAGAVRVLERVDLGLARHRRPRRAAVGAQGRERAAQHRRGLDPDVRRVACHPHQEVAGDGVEPLRRRRVEAGRGDVGDAHRHRRVVAPLAGREVAQPTAEHLGRLAEVGWLPELVGHAERVADRLPEQHPGSTVALRLVQLHGRLP